MNLRFLLLSGGALRPSGKLVAGKTKRKLERQESKREEKKLSIKDARNFFEEHNKVKDGLKTSQIIYKSLFFKKKAYL